MKDIYQFDDYKNYLKEALTHLGHGSRIKFAHALNCQSAYITQVLNKEAHLSLEQAADASAFLKLDHDEEDFFLTLVQIARAGTERLRKLYGKKIKDIREKRSLLSNRVTGTTELDEKAKAIYYSRWYYAAIHVLVTIPHFQTKEKISKYLGLSSRVVNEAIEFLLSVGLIISREGKFESGEARVFLKGDSPFIVQHHENWRLRAIENITSGQKENVHFSSVYSLSKQDFIRIKERLLREVQEIREIVKPSKEEELCVLNIDFFHLDMSEK